MSELREDIAKIISRDFGCSLTTGLNVAKEIIEVLPPPSVSEAEIEKIFDKHTIVANNDILYRKGLSRALFTKLSAKEEYPPYPSEVTIKPLPPKEVKECKHEWEFMRVVYPHYFSDERRERYCCKHCLETIDKSVI